MVYKTDHMIIYLVIVTTYLTSPLQIGDYPAKNLTYAEALELISDLSDGYYFMLVAENKSGDCHVTQ